MQNSEPTRAQWDAYLAMFHYFNKELFGGELPGVVLNFSRAARSLGFFAPERWRPREGDDKIHEISLNPDHLTERDPRDVASTLVHEMAHLWRQITGEAPRPGYHDRAWAEKMERLGLMPSNTGAPGGKRTGAKMTHYIIDGGPFACAFGAMPPAFLLPWRSDARGGGPAKKDTSKVKYSCDGCSLNVWGKRGIRIICGECGAPIEPA